MKLKKGKCRVLHLGRDNPQYHMLRADPLEIGSSRKDIGVLVHDKFTMSWSCVRRQWDPGMYQEERGLQVREGILPPLLGPTEAHLQCCIQFWIPQ